MNISYKQNESGYVDIRCPFVAKNKISKSSCLFTCKYFSHFPNTSYDMFTCKYIKVLKKSYKTYNKRRYRKLIGGCDLCGKAYSIVFKKE